MGEGDGPAGAGGRAGRGPDAASRSGWCSARFLAFTGIDSCAKWLVLRGLPATEVAFVRYAVHLGIVLAIGAAAGRAAVGDQRTSGRSACGRRCCSAARS